jgi:two-component system alkaline phosphatase synthesis response regulator PhoP
MSTDDRPINPAADAPLSEAALDAEINLARASILIVDDQEQNVELLEAYLDDLGCTIHTAHDGVEAMKKIDTSPPDLVILDVMMPKMSGYQVCQRIKDNPATRDIPVMMVTALSETGDIERAVENGADDFLTKPVHKLELVTRAKSLLRVRLLRQQLDAALRKLGQ